MKPFVFIDGWRLFCSNGVYMNISEKDLINYEENGLTDDEIKAISYSYLTSDNLYDFSNRGIQSYEF